MTESNPLLSIKAGIVDYDEETFQATPKPGPGLIKVTKNPDDPMFCSFVWEARPTQGKATSEDLNREELLLFPGDAHWRHIPECTTGRVFELKFSSSGLRHVFWMQSLTDGKDVAALSTEDIANAKIMDKILQGDESEDEEMDEVDPAFPQVSDEPRTTLDQVEKLLENIRNNRAKAAPIYSIADAIPYSKMIDYINDLDETALEPFLKRIPQGLPQTKEELIRIIQSPQFDQGLQSFDSVLNEAGIGALIAGQLGIAYSGEGVQGYLDGVRKNQEDDRMGRSRRKRRQEGKDT